MFLKVVKSKGNEYLRIVESYREGGKVRHRIVLNLGRLDQIEGNPSFQRLGERLLELSRGSFVNLKDASEGELFNYGYTVHEKIWNDFDLPKLLELLLSDRDLEFNLSDACLLMVIQHLLEPKSKLATLKGQGRYLNLPQVGYNHLYRALDIIAEKKETLEQALFERGRSLFNMQVDVVFYDVTTFYFESVKANSLKDFGFSKDGKFKEVQVVLGLITDCEGRPIGYELFPGDTFDGKTLLKALEDMERLFGIRRIVVVADKGINSKLNLKLIRDKGYDYIVAARLKSMNSFVIKSALDMEGYTFLNEGKESEFRYKVLPYVNVMKDEEGQRHQLKERLIVTFSKERAEKDRSDRRRLLERAEELLETPSLIDSSNKRGGKKYIKDAGAKPTWTLDAGAVTRDALFDGYYAIQTSTHDMTAMEIMDVYHKLWKIEDSFRIMKSTLEVRPIFHWTERRIKGHFLICFLAFLLERTLESKLKCLDPKPSPAQIREALNSMSFTKVSVKGEEFLIRVKGTPLSQKILQVMRMKSPKNVTPVKDVSLV